MKDLPKYKHGKQLETMSFKEWKEKMDKAKVFRRWYKGLLAFLFYTGVRVSEATDRVKEDFKIEGDILIVNAPAKKHGQRSNLELPLELPFIDLVVKRVKRCRKQKKVFSISPRHANRLVKQVFGEKYYCHYFRLNRATLFLEDPETTIPEMKAWFGWKKMETISSYIGLSKRGIKAQSNRLRQEIQ